MANLTQIRRALKLIEKLRSLNAPTNGDAIFDSYSEATR